mgnify:CR=1
MKGIIILVFVVLPVILYGSIWLSGGEWLPITKITILTALLIYGTIAWLKI